MTPKTGVEQKSFEGSWSKSFTIDVCSQLEAGGKHQWTGLAELSDSKKIFFCNWIFREEKNFKKKNLFFM